MAVNGCPVFGCFAVAIQSLTVRLNSSVVMPEWVAVSRATTPASPPAVTPCKSPLSTEAKGSCVFHSGCCGASALTLSIRKKSCV